ncbi:hypothetical protein CAL7716_066510 [Calothrix sp. PCC 7716]|nr:hypothetical protein CAL7716_066510 [Calothrix sp. PCC 7716]
MIKFKQDNLLLQNAEALVNTVNCVGVMGKGIALQFKRAYPENFRSYQKASKAAEVKPANGFLTTSFATRKLEFHSYTLTMFPLNIKTGGIKEIKQL